jgi:ABC-type transport system involved in multi-copper enzyme maturation permease subunit
MVRDTFRQSVATKLFWVMLAVTGVCILVCLSVDVVGDMPKLTHPFEVPAFLPPGEAQRLGEDVVREDGVRVVSGEVSLGFGMMTVKLGRNRDDAVKYLQIILAAFLADTVGVLLALLWTAGFIPTFLEAQSATVLLSKPAPRWLILAGKYLGVVLFVTLHAVLFVAGTWVALGIKTGVWNGTYWLAVPLLVISFGTFYAVSTFLAVCTRSTVAAAFGTLLFWLLCWAVNYTHIKLSTDPPQGLTPTAQVLLKAGYWALPKPMDFNAIFHDAIGAEGYLAQVPELQFAQTHGQLHPEWAVISSIAFAGVVLGLAAYEFRQMDY